MRGDGLFPANSTTFSGAGVRAALRRHIRHRWRVLAVGLALGLIPLALEAPHLLQAGFPYLGDGISNLLPPLHARYSLTHGRLPIYTELWYGGEYQFMNPLWKGLYPPAWPLFVPGVPLLPALKAILAAHYVATPAVAYWYARKDFPPAVAVPFALVFAMPMAAFNGHYEKVLAWPWVVLLAWQLTPPRITRRPRRAGVLAGVALGAMLLAGGVYWFFYSCCLVATVVVALRQRSFVRGAATGALVGVPKVLLSVLPVLWFGANRPAGGRGLTLQQFVAGITGFWIDVSELAIAVRETIFSEGYAVVGLPAVLLAVAGVGYAYFRPREGGREEGKMRSRWLLGVVGAGLLGTLLASEWTYLYADVVPIVSMFRVAARANVLVALAVLLAAWFALRVVTRRAERADTDHRRSTVAVGGAALLLVLTGVNGGVVWAITDNGNAQPAGVGERIAEDIAAAGCDAAWLEGSNAPWELPESDPRAAARAQGRVQPRVVDTPYQKQIAYALTERGVSLTAVNYGRFGQSYATHTNGQLTFDVLVVPISLPENSTMALTGGWVVPSRGRIKTGQFDLFQRYRTDKGPVYVYTTGTC